MPKVETVSEFLKTPLEERKKKSKVYLDNNPSKVPVLVESVEKEWEFEKSKFLLPKNFNIAKLALMVKQYKKSKEDEAMYIYAGNRIMRADKLIGKIYEEYKEKDGFLYLRISNVPSLG